MVKDILLVQFTIGKCRGDLVETVAPLASYVNFMFY